MYYLMNVSLIINNITLPFKLSNSYKTRAAFDTAQSDRRAVAEVDTFAQELEAILNKKTPTNGGMQKIANKVKIGSKTHVVHIGRSFFI